MTRRGLGCCGEPGAVEALNTGFGRGRRRGWRHRYYATGVPGRGRTSSLPGEVPAHAPGLSAEQEARELEAQAEELERSLAWLKSRISELNATRQATPKSDATSP